MPRTEGVVLVARKDSEFWFIDSVFEHSNDLAGCTGTICYPVSEKYMEELLSPDSVEDRFADYWEEESKKKVRDDCEECDGYPNEEGCEFCDYQSLRDLCLDIVNCDGSDAMIDDLGSNYSDAMEEVGEDAEYADCTGCGRIFGSWGQDKPMSHNDFDDVYNRKALVACLAYEDGMISYEHAARVIFGTVAG